MTDRFDPLETSALISSGYRRYLRSLLPVRDPRIATALDHVITHSPLLTKGPLLEATPPYQPGATLDALIREGVLNPAFRKLDSDALPLARPLHTHQEQAIRKVGRRAQCGRRHGYRVWQDRKLPSPHPRRPVR